VSDTIPAGTTGSVGPGGDEVADGCAITSGVFSCTTVARLNSGAHRTYHLKLVVDAGYRLDTGPSTDPVNTVTNTASVSADPNNNDPTSGNNSGSDTDNVIAKSDLAVSKDDGATSVIAGATAGTTYTITVTNNGPSDEPAGIKVNDAIPAGTTGSVGTGGDEVADGCAITSGVFSCTTVARLNVGASRTYHLKLVVNAGYRLDQTPFTSVTNTASVATDPNNNDPTSSNNSSSDTDSVVAQSDLAVTKSDGVSSVIAGTSTTYAITVTNNGPTDEPAGIVLTDTLPAGTTGSESEANCSITGAAPGVFSCTTVTRLNAGASRTYHVTLAVSAGYHHNIGSSLVNAASVSTDPNANDPDSSNNTGSDTDTVGTSADLSILKTGPTSPQVPGYPAGFNFTIRVSNGGPSDSEGFNVTDTLPTGLTFQAAGSSSSCSAVGQVVTCTNGILGAGSFVNFTVHVFMANSVVEGTQLTNTATVATTGVPDPVSTNNSSSAVVFTKFFGLIGLNSITVGAQNGRVDGVESNPTQPPVFVPGQFVDMLSNGLITVGGAKIFGSVRTTQGKVTIQSGSVITGDVFAGQTITNQGTVQGTLYPNQPTAAITASVTWSPCAFDSPGALRSKITSGNYTYSASTGDISVSSNGNVVTLSNGTYCFRNITVSGGASIRVNGPVTIYVKGTITASGGAFSNATNIPADLKILDSYNGTNGVNISGGSQSLLTLYAPLTDVIISGNSPLWGAVLGKTITSSGNAIVHVDLNIGDTSSWAPGLHLV
jgi:uncharacterized repeat protein (TIGR01451 family)